MATANRTVITLTLLALLLVGSGTGKAGHTRAATAHDAAGSQQTAVILVDDFVPQPAIGDSHCPVSGVWCHNRLGGDRGQINDPIHGNDGLTWGKGVVTATITQGTNTFKGVWTALNHPISDHSSLNFSAIFPPQILPEYQGRITGLRIESPGGAGTFQVELRAFDPAAPFQERTVFMRQAALPAAQPLSFTLPLTLTQIQNLNWNVLGNAGDYVAVKRVELMAELPQLDTPRRAFLWSYAMLLNNWDPISGLTRVHADGKRGEYDNISASGMQAAAAVMAWRLSFISRASAVEIVERTTQALLALPRDEQCGSRLWPHFVKNGQIVPGTEWSSIDTIIAIVALLEAQQALGIDTTAVLGVLDTINWEALLLNGSIRHGYFSDCRPLGSAVWTDFGTESWLVNFGHAAATGNVAEFDHTAPTFNGSGFIDEMAWLLLPVPCHDRWGTPWCEYQEAAVDLQLDYYKDHPCNSGPPRLFGLSDAEVPDLSAVPITETYKAYGVGGEIPPYDGGGVIVPYYAAMIAALRPAQAIALWEWIEAHGIFTPLNNVETFKITNLQTCSPLIWNARKDSWQLSLQTLGWGRLLTEGNHPLHFAMWANDRLRRAYTIMWNPAYRIHLPLIRKPS